EGFWPADIPKVAIFGAVVSGNIEQMETITVKPLTKFDVALFEISGFTLVEQNGKEYLVCGTRLGNFLVFDLEGIPNSLRRSGFIVDKSGVVQRHPVV